MHALTPQVFKVFDLDGSGFIDRTELKAMMASLETKSFRAPPEEEVDAMLNDADQNRVREAPTAPTRARPRRHARAHASTRACLNARTPRRTHTCPDAHTP